MARVEVPSGWDSWEVSLLDDVIVASLDESEHFVFPITRYPSLEEFWVSEGGEESWEPADTVALDNPTKPARLPQEVWDEVVRVANAGDDK